MPIIMQINQLIAPLREYPQCILQKRHHNQEPPNGRQVRLEWVAESVQPVLDLTRLLADGIERGRVVGGILSRGPAGAKRVLVAKVVACCASDLRHVCAVLCLYGVAEEEDRLLRGGCGIIIRRSWC